jgi:hypothetical protein
MEVIFGDERPFRFTRFGHCQDVRSAAGLTILLALGFVASTAVAGRSTAPTLTITTTLPQITTTLPVSTTLPQITTTLPVNTTVPQITTTLPVSTTVPKITTTLAVSTTVPKITTTLPVATTAPISTALPKTATTSPTTAASTVAGAGAGVTLLPGGNGSGSSAPGAASAGLFTSSPGGPSAASMAVTHLRSSQRFLVLHGPKGRRSTILTFRLRHAGRVRFTVVQVFPRCRVVGFFTVRGHAGVNRVRFNARLHGRQLPVGTYQIGLRTRRGTLLRVTLAIFDSPASSPSAVAAARKRNVCGATAAFAANGPFATVGFSMTGGAGSTAAAGSSSSSGSDHHVLGIDFGALAPENLAKDGGKNPFAIVALGLAVLLFGLGAVREVVVHLRK